MGLPRPCLDCGTPTPHSRCDDCKRPDNRGIRSHPFLHTQRWKRLSKRLRAQSPQCEKCGSTTALSVDHIVPASERADLIFVVHNLRVWCMDCQRRRGNHCTGEERQMVEDRIAKYKRAGQGFPPFTRL
ncbi:HNH endonuclease [Mycobacterium arosiense]|uniref:HNH endonuclease n=1 Tax=Mycobacterium arosiense TaxID=425468 RepID=UPI00114DD606